MPWKLFTKINSIAKHKNFTKYCESMILLDALYFPCCYHITFWFSHLQKMSSFAIIKIYHHHHNHVLKLNNIFFVPSYKNRTDSCIQLFSLAALATLVLWCPNFIENIYQLMITDLLYYNYFCVWWGIIVIRIFIDK